MRRKRKCVNSVDTKKSWGLVQVPWVRVLEGQMSPGAVKAGHMVKKGRMQGTEENYRFCQQGILIHCHGGNFSHFIVPLNYKSKSNTCSKQLHWAWKTSYLWLGRFVQTTDTKTPQVVMLFFQGSLLLASFTSPGRKHSARDDNESWVFQRQKSWGLVQVLPLIRQGPVAKPLTFSSLGFSPVKQTQQCCWLTGLQQG